jgi:hypothetical protein
MDFVKTMIGILAMADTDFSKFCYTLPPNDFSPFWPGRLGHR